MENGAIRNFESIRLAEKKAEAEAKLEKEEEANNPMKLLENRTRDSRREMAIIESLEDLKELNTKNASFDPLEIVRVQEEYEKQLQKLQEEEDENEIKRLFSKNKAHDEESDELNSHMLIKKPKLELKKDNKQKSSKAINAKNESSFSNEKKISKLTLLVKKKDNTNESKNTIEHTQNIEVPKQGNGLINLCAYGDDDEISDN